MNTDEPVPVTSATNRFEADMVCDLLRTAGSQCGMARTTSDSAYGGLLAGQTAIFGPARTPEGRLRTAPDHGDDYGQAYAGVTPFGTTRRAHPPSVAEMRPGHEGWIDGGHVVLSVDGNLVVQASCPLFESGTSVMGEVHVAMRPDGLLRVVVPNGYRFTAAPDDGNRLVGVAEVWERSRLIGSPRLLASNDPAASIGRPQRSQRQRELG